MIDLLWFVVMCGFQADPYLVMNLHVEFELIVLPLKLRPYVEVEI